MRIASELVTAARTISRNAANSDGTFAVSDAEIVQYLNDAQDRIQNLISSAKNIAKIFVNEAIISVVQNQEAYSVPDRVLLNKQLEHVEFSATGNLSDYIRLEKLNFFNRDTNGTTYPHGYIKRGGQILLTPLPSTAQGSIRISYERECDDIALRLGIVVNATDLQIVISSVVTSLVPSGADYICITSRLGERLALNIPVSSYAPGVISATTISSYLVGSATLASLTGGYVTVGRYSTCIPALPDNCERYLIHYAAAELFHKDSSKDYDAEIALLGEIEKDIIKALSSQTSEIQFTPQLQRYEWW